MSLAGCQINPIDVNFHLQKCLEISDKNSADKLWSKKDRGWKVPSLMPIRVKINQVIQQPTESDTDVEHLSTQLFTE